MYKREIRQSENKHHWFVDQYMVAAHEWRIDKVFYSKEKAEAYINKHTKEK